MRITASQIKAARALVGWSQQDLAAACRVSSQTIKRLEGSDSGQLVGSEALVTSVVAALQSAGVEFIQTLERAGVMHSPKPSEPWMDLSFEASSPRKSRTAR